MSGQPEESPEARLLAAGFTRRRQDFRRLVVRITDELERVEVLSADDLKALMEADRGERRGNTQP
jgi:hypothetical protein